MRKRLIATAAAASLLTLATPSPSSAEVTHVEVHANDVTVKYDACRTSKVEVTGDWELEPYNEIQVTVRKPNGRVFDTDAFYDDYDGAVNMRVQLCGGNKPGKYRVEVVAIGYDEFYEETSRADAATSFTYTHIPKARARVQRRVHYTPNQRKYKYQVPGRLLRDGRRLAKVRVVLAVRIQGDWYAIDKMRTNRRGYFGWRFKPNRFRWCYVFTGNRSTKPGVSRVFETPRRRSSRPVTARAVTPEASLRLAVADLARVQGLLRKTRT